MSLKLVGLAILASGVVAAAMPEAYSELLGMDSSDSATAAGTPFD